MNPLQTKVQFSSVGETLEVPVINQLMSLPLENPEILSLAAGFTDNAVLPAQMIKDIVSRLPETNPNNEYLQYGTTQGRANLRNLTVEYLNGIEVESNNAFSEELTFITNGSQQALFLATQTICNPGDYVLVENPTYFVYLSMLQGLQINPIGIPVDEKDEIDTEALSEVLQKLKSENNLHRVKLAYLLGYHANPSSRCLKLHEKDSFAQTLYDFDLQIPIIEDAAYRELNYAEMNPTPSIMSLDSYQDFPKLYLGTYTKPFATGLKIGYGSCSHDEWFEKMVCSKGNQDFGTSNFSQAIIERVLTEDRYQPLIQSLGKHYGKKAELMNEVLTHSGIQNNGWIWQKPKGGLLFWMRAPETVNTAMKEPFCNACKKKGVIYVPGHFCFAADNPHHFLRLSIGALNNDKLIEACDRFCKVALKF